MIVPNTPEWYEARLGLLTASKAAVIMGGLDTSGLDGYVKDLAWERVHGLRDEGYRSAAMERGHEYEPQAREWYAFARDVTVPPPTIIKHPSVPYVAATPDGLLDDRVLEIKCPLHKAWMETKRTRQVPSEYRWQVRWQAWCAGRLLIDFVAFHPVPGGLIVPFELKPAEAEQMAERAAIVEERVQRWVDILCDEWAGV